MTQCNPSPFAFHPLGPRDVVGAFDGGKVTSDAGALILRELEVRFGFLSQFSGCFKDYRDPERIEHTVFDLVSQRVLGLCLGYEDLNDHDFLRFDPLFATAVGKTDPLGETRLAPQDQGKALAGKSTLNRLELTPPGASAGSRYKKIVGNVADMQRFLVEAYIIQQRQRPERIVLDVDSTNDPIHGHQLGRFFHGYYDEYCYLPLYIFCGDHPLCALLRPSDIDGAAGALKQIQRIVERLRQQWPGIEIIVRGDSGFCRNSIMRWCEQNQVHFLFGLAKNTRLKKILGGEMQRAKLQYEATHEPSREFRDFRYQTRKSWSCERRVVGKAEHLAKGANPRFVVTSLSTEQFDARTLYEQEYCARGQMENRIKEQQLFLFADRTSCHTMRANQIRLLLSTVGYVMMRALREFGLQETELAQAQCDTIRLKVLKIGAVVKISVRRVYVSLSESYPFRTLFEQVWANVQKLAPIKWGQPAIVTP
jgi:hypothetical protein